MHEVESQVPSNLRCEGSNEAHHEVSRTKTSRIWGHVSTAISLEQLLYSVFVLLSCLSTHTHWKSPFLDRWKCPYVHSNLILVFLFLIYLYDRLSPSTSVHDPISFAFYGCIIFHCMYVLHFLYPFVLSWIFRLLPYQGHG